MRKYISFFIVLTLVFIVGCSNASPEDSSSSTESPSATESATKEPVAEATEATSEKTSEEAEASAEGQLELTLEELADYDGTDGKPAYIAVDGIIYDVTNSGPWSKGTHNGYSAGKDLTKEIKEVSPHGVSKLGNVEAVGILVTN
jgi:predicted heme/steroid binding protein